MLQGEHSAILSTFIKLSFIINIFVLSFFEWLFYTGFTVVCSFESIYVILASSLASLCSWANLIDTNLVANPRAKTSDSLGLYHG